DARALGVGRVGASGQVERDRAAAAAADLQVRARTAGFRRFFDVVAERRVSARALPAVLELEEVVVGARVERAGRRPPALVDPEEREPADAARDLEALEELGVGRVAGDERRGRAVELDRQAVLLREL